MYFWRGKTKTSNIGRPVSQRQRRVKQKSKVTVARLCSGVVLSARSLVWVLVYVDVNQNFINHKLNAHGVSIFFVTVCRGGYKCNWVGSSTLCFMSSSTLCNVIITFTVIKVDEWMWGRFDQHEDIMTLLIIAISIINDYLSRKWINDYDHVPLASILLPEMIIWKLPKYSSLLTDSEEFLLNDF